MVDYSYNGINTYIKPLESTNFMYYEIVKYVTNTQGSTHDCKLKVLDIFEVSQHNKSLAFETYCKDINNRVLLYHGSSITNWLSILKHDLLINPRSVKSNVSIAGKMFGNGIYFADSVSKSFNYCNASRSKNIACLALAEVALGNTSQLINSDSSLDLKKVNKTGHNSVFGMGKETPITFGKINNIMVPNSRLTKSTKKAYLQYDEFIVYHSNQQVIRYLILVSDSS